MIRPNHLPFGRHNYFWSNSRDI